VRRTSQFYFPIDRADCTPGTVPSASIVAHCAALSPLVAVAPQRRPPTVLPEARTCPARSRPPRVICTPTCYSAHAKKIIDRPSVTPGKWVSTCSAHRLRELVRGPAPRQSVLSLCPCAERANHEPHQQTQLQALPQPASPLPLLSISPFLPLPRETSAHCARRRPPAAHQFPPWRGNPRTRRCGSWCSASTAHSPSRTRA
jgi:hypothetical protein